MKATPLAPPAPPTGALVAQSGGAESVPARAILGLRPDNAIVSPQSQAVYRGRDLLKAPLAEMQRLRGKDISVIFQEPMTSLNPGVTIGLMRLGVLGAMRQTIRSLTK